jgi:hypothetical protein
MAENDYSVDGKENHGEKDWNHFRYTWASEIGSSRNTENL